MNKDTDFEQESQNSQNIFPDYLSVRFYERLRYSLPYLNEKYLEKELEKAEELSLFFGW